MTIARAIARSLKLPDRLPQTSTRTAGLSAMGGLMGGGGAQGGYQAYKDVGAAYGPIRRICQSVSLVNWSLYQQTEKAGKVDRTLIDDATAPARHPGTAIWTQPNPFMSRRVFLYQTQLWKIGAGGVYWLMVKGGANASPFPERGMTADFELWPIRADRITSIADPDKYLAGYVYSLGTERIPLPVQAVIPIGWPDPLDPLGFAGPLQSIMTDLEAEKYASQYNRNVFLNNARPGGVIEFETPLSPDRFEELVIRWREQHQGLNNAARVAIIEGGKWVDTGMSNTDMEYEKLRKLDRETVMFALGMPFAVMQTNDVNLANAQMADKQFYRWTLRPELEDYKEPLNQRVLPLIADNLTMDFDLPAPEDEAFDVFASTSGWLSGVNTQNEARQGMGFDAIPDGDRYVWELPNASGPAPIAMPPARNPRAPTRLSYRVEAKASPPMTGHETQMSTEWGRRLHDLRRQYQDFLANRNGH